ncbi:MAG: hypothetical protein ACXW07_08050 [Nitrososphaeraceae archaeon]
MNTKTNIMCTISADALERQLIIDSIPHCMMITILAVTTVLIIWWYNIFKMEQSLNFRMKTFWVLILCIVLLPLWYQASYLLSSILTNIANPEYASIFKYVQGCPISLEPSTK